MRNRNSACSVVAFSADAQLQARRGEQERRPQRRLRSQFRLKFCQECSGVWDRDLNAVSVEAQGLAGQSVAVSQEELLAVRHVRQHRPGPAQRDEMLDVARRVPNSRSVALPADTLIETFEDIARETRAFVEGAEPDEIPDSVLATVLFTDLVGSTERAAALGDRAWRDLLTRHHEDVRRELARFRGEEVDSSGDGFFCRFDGPARAIACARSIVSAARELDLDVRAGVHSGECEVVGEKIAGISVVTGARVSALAGPGEVLVSQTVKDLVAGSGFGFIDRGAHELKGVPGSWRLYVVADG